MKTPRWNEAPLQVLTLPTLACPFCASATKPILVRSSQTADGARWQRCVCRKCSRRWQRVFLPSSGDAAD